MTKLLVMYKTPQDKALFDKYYAENHIPLAKKMPGLKRYDVSIGGVGTPAGPADYHLIAALEFDSQEAMQNAFQSAEGQAAQADMQNFAAAGADVLIFDTLEV